MAQDALSRLALLLGSRRGVASHAQPAPTPAETGPFIAPPPVRTRKPLPKDLPRSGGQRVFNEGVDALLGALGVKDALGAETPTAGTAVGQLASMLSPLAMMGASVRQMNLPLGVLPKLPTRAELATAERIRQGYTVPAFHGTQAVIPKVVGEGIVHTEAIPSLKRGGPGLKMMDGLGVHSGTAKAADQRTTSYHGTYGFDALAEKLGRKPDLSVGKLEESYTIPLWLKAENPLLGADGTPMSETALQAKLSRLAQKLGFPKESVRRYSPHSREAGLRQAQQAVREELQRQGYDSIPYINSHEDRGSVSWIVLNPSQARSKFADFHPWRTKSKDLLAGIVPPLAAAAAGLRPEPSHPPKR